MTDPTTEPSLCSAASNCLQVAHHPDGSITLWSSRRPDQRITLDPDEVPVWLRPVDGDLRTLAIEALADYATEPYGDVRLNPERGAAKVLAAVLPVRARQHAARLREVAAYRREYLGAALPSDVARLIEQEVMTLDTAARIVEGDLEPLYGLLPSWRWTDEMNARLRERAATGPADGPASTETAEQPVPGEPTTFEPHTVPLETLIEELSTADSMFRDSVERTERELAEVVPQATPSGSEAAQEASPAPDERETARRRMAAMAARARDRKATAPDYPDTPEQIAEQAATTEALSADRQARTIADLVKTGDEALSELARIGDERDRQAATIQRVRELHTEYDGRCTACVAWCDCLDQVHELGDDVEVAATARMCPHGNLPWPCPTAAALGDADQEVRTDG